jgi:hypothetical protein
VRDVISLPEPFTPPWSLHDEPDRPLDEHAQLCSCMTCEEALLAQAVTTPRLPLALRTEADRVVVTLEYLVEVMQVDRTLEPLMYVVGDRVRSLYVPVEWWRVPSWRRWWSLSCHEDETAAGRRHPRHRVAKRQSKAARRAAERRVRADAPPPGPPVQFAELASVVAPWRSQHRGLVNEVRQHALAHGESLHADTIAMILAARETPMFEDQRRPIGRWTKRDLIDFLSVDLFNWCSIRQVLLPDQVPEALSHLLEVLVATDALDDDSDPLDELSKPLRCYGGLEATGQRRPESDNESERERCECYVTYRGPSHGELRARLSAEVTR